MSLANKREDGLSRRQTTALREYMNDVRRRLTRRRVTFATAIDLVNAAHAALCGKPAMCECAFLLIAERHGADFRTIQ